MASMQTFAGGMMVVLALLSVSVAGARSYPAYHTITRQQQRSSQPSGATDSTCYLPAPYLITNFRASYTPSGDMVACGDLSTQPVSDRIEAWDLWAMQLEVSGAGECYDAVKAVTFGGQVMKPTVTKQAIELSAAVQVSGVSNAPLTKYVYSGYQSPIEVCIILTGQCADPSYLHSSITYLSEYGPEFCATTNLPALSTPAIPSSPESSPAHATPRSAHMRGTSSSSLVEGTRSPVYKPSPSPYNHPQILANLPSASPLKGNAAEPSPSHATSTYAQSSENVHGTVDRTTYLWHSTY